MNLHKEVEKWANKRYAPNDVKIIVTENSIEFKPTGHTAKYNEDYYSQITRLINGAIYFHQYITEKKLI